MARLNSDGVASALKEQLLLFSFLVVFAGMISTDTYYAAFGLKYQFIDLSTEHLVYRGITALFQSPSLAIPYLLAIGWLSAGWPLLLRRHPRQVLWLSLGTYGLIAAVTVAAYFAAISAGRAAAAADLDAKLSHLPTIQSIVGTEGEKLGYEGHRLLISGKDTLAVFKPVNNAAEVPFIHLLKRDEISDLVISR